MAASQKRGLAIAPKFTQEQLQAQIRADDAARKEKRKKAKIDKEEREHKKKLEAAQAELVEREAAGDSGLTVNHTTYAVEKLRLEPSPEEMQAKKAIEAAVALKTLHEDFEVEHPGHN